MRALVLFLALAVAASAQDSWKALEAWAGEWTAEASTGSPGQATAGASTFAFDLYSHVMIRKSFAEYPAAEGRPAYRHEDLMVVWPRPRMKASYWDNEGHVIHYNVTASSERLEFISEAGAKEPRYRLTYTKTGPHAATLTFEMAPPGQPDAFKPYVTASLRRRKS